MLLCPSFLRPHTHKKVRQLPKLTGTFLHSSSWTESARKALYQNITEGREYDTSVAGYEVAAVLLKTLVFWDVTVCRMVNGEDTRKGRGAGVHKFPSNLEATSRF